MPASSVEDREAICDMVQAGLKARITALARPSKGDIDMAADCGVWCATISIPIGDLQREFKLGWDDETYIRTLLEKADYAKKRDYMSMSACMTQRA